MNWKIVRYILLGVVTFTIWVIFLVSFVVEPWIEKKIQAELNKINKNYTVEIGSFQFLILKSGIEMETIKIKSKSKTVDKDDLNGEIQSIKVKGINLFKTIFTDNIVLNEINISNTRIIGKISFSGIADHPFTSPANIHIGKILLDRIDIAIQNTSSAQSYSVKNGVLTLYHLQLLKRETFSRKLIVPHDFSSTELVIVSPDSIYTCIMRNISYSGTSNTIEVKQCSVHPNYTGNDFTSRYNFQTDRIEAEIKNIRFQNFSATNYLKTNNLECSFMEIENMDIKVLRDKRKAFRHVNKPTFQEMIYKLPFRINIDSIALLNANATYMEQAKQATQPGEVNFTQIQAKIYKITNDTKYKTKNDSLELRIEALVMGKAKIRIFLKSIIFDSQNSFTLNGTLARLELIKLNPFLAKNNFIYITSGSIDGLSFRLLANNHKATGTVTMLYHGLDVALKNKRTGDTTSLKDRILSLIANSKLIDSNPLPGKEVRVGRIDYKRDPEKFLFNYCFKSILSGITSTIDKRQQREKKP